VRKVAGKSDQGERKRLEIKEMCSEEKEIKR
jgi:hypothetical protein